MSTNCKLMNPYCSLLLLFTLFLGSCAQPIARFSLSPEQEIRAGQTVVEFQNESERSESYEWQIGPETQSTETNPTHRFFKSGTYTVELTATDAKGRSKTKKERIEVLPPQQCLVLIETPEGNMIAELSDATPLHQDNFTKLADEGFYDSLLFHRVIRNFMIQGGDPNSRNAPKNRRLGSGGPGYQIDAEFVDSLAHVKGALAAARTNNPKKRSSGSQFYIVQGKPVTEAELDKQEAQYQFRYPSEVRETYLELGGTPFLDQNYTVFGRVIEGLEVIDRIARQRTASGDRPTEDVWMRIRLIR